MNTKNSLNWVNTQGQNKNIDVELDNLQNQITTNANNIYTNTVDIVQNTADIATNTSDITTNTQDIAQLQADKVNLSDLINLIYPIGSVYISTNNVSPATFLGGTWQAFAEGRTLIGVGNSDQLFSAGQNGGSSNVTLSINQIPSHSHGLRDSAGRTILEEPGQGLPPDVPFRTLIVPTTNYDAFGTPPQLSTNTAGLSQSHSNLPPYIVTYMWERTA